MSATTVPGFDAATAATGEPAGPRRVEIGTGYGGFVGAHGGFVTAIALRAMAELIADSARVARSLSIQLLAPVRPGPLELLGRISRAGRSMSAASVTLEQEGAVVAAALGSFGLASPSLQRRDIAMPDVPPPEECPVVELTPPETGSFKLLVAHRAAAPPLPLSGANDPTLVVWMRLTEDRPVDALSVCMLADGAPPALFATLTGFAPIPSTDITLHFGPGIGTSASPWVLGVFRNRTAAGGYAVEDGELWSPGGELLVQSRQLRRLL